MTDKIKEIKLTDIELKEIKYINSMSQEQMASLWRNASSGHPYFDTTRPYFKVFDKRFKDFTSVISKRIGWD